MTELKMLEAMAKATEEYRIMQRMPACLFLKAVR
jgi:hypothetical protein